MCQRVELVLGFPGAQGQLLPPPNGCRMSFPSLFFQAWSLMDSSLISPLPKLSSDAALAIRS